MTVVAGVDGCRAGWLVALRNDDEVEISVVPTIGEILATGAGSIAIDIPIGLPSGGSRPCDVAARRLLGPRRSSVFPAPTRAAVASHPQGFEATLAANRASSGRGISLQAFHLLPKIGEVDAALAPSDQVRVVESHPELAFARLGGRPLPDPKRTVAGRAERLALLASDLPQTARLLAAKPRGCAADDLLDALVLTITARRLQAGGAERVGGDLDERGLRMEIAW